MTYDDYDPENYSGPAPVSPLSDLEPRIDELESRIGNVGGGSSGLSLGYALGMCIAVVLSWSRNASILWCIAHGICSWGYVIYVAISDWTSKS